MSKYGSSSVWFLLDGYSMVVNKLQGLRCKVEALTEPTHGLGDTWEEHTPVGVSRAELAQEGAFFFGDSGYMHNLQSTAISSQGPTSTAKVACLGFSALTTGQDFVGIAGEFQSEYEVLGQRGNLTRANAAYVVTGQAENGKILRSLTATTGDATTYYDGTAATTNSGTAYFQVTSIALGASTGVALSVMDASTSSGPFVSIASVTVSTVGAWRVDSTDASVDRWLAGDVNFSSAATSDSPSITCFIGFARL